ncbi:hypothetical protein D3C87_1525610 [compost metagenome]
MHQAAAFVVVDEEVAVDAEAELAQFFQHSLLGLGIAVAVVVQRLDQALGHFHVVFQLRALARQNAVFDQLRLLIAQLAIEGNHQRADDGNGQHQRQNPEGDDLVFELHVDSCPREGSASYAKDTPCRSELARDGISGAEWCRLYVFREQARSYKKGMGSST